MTEKADRKYKTDKCVICNKDSNIESDTPISMRKYYVSGCGQLCESCFKKIGQGLQKNKI